MTACILADTPSPIPVAPETPPAILTASLMPPATNILTEWPPYGAFTIPVFDENPSPAGVSAAIFVDYDNGKAGLGYLCTVGPITPNAFSSATYDFDLTCPDPSLVGCHTIEAFVVDGAGDVTRHLAGATNSASATWFYSSTGNTNSCSSIDAGPPSKGDAAAPRSSSDAAQD